MAFLDSWPEPFYTGGVLVVLFLKYISLVINLDNCTIIVTVSWLMYHSTGKGKMEAVMKVNYEESFEPSYLHTNS